MKVRRTLGIVFCLALWFGLTNFGLVKPLFLASPQDTFMSLIRLAESGTLSEDLFMTVYRLFVAFGIGALFGVMLGILFGYFDLVYESLEVVVDFFRSIPVMCLFPLFMIVFGLGDLSKFFIGAWSSSLIILVSTMYGVRRGKKERLMVARAMGATKLQLITKIVLPEAAPDIVVGFRQGVSICLIVVVISEMFMGTFTGLGQRIYDAGLMYRIPEMYGAIIVTGLLGYGVNKAFEVLGRRIVHWTQI